MPPVYCAAWSRSRSALSTDYETIGLSLEFHPMALLRPQLNKLKAITAVQLQTTKNGRR